LFEGLRHRAMFRCGKPTKVAASEPRCAQTVEPNRLQVELRARTRIGAAADTGRALFGATSRARNEKLFEAVRPVQSKSPRGIGPACLFALWLYARAGVCRGGEVPGLSQSTGYRWICGGVW